MRFERIVLSIERRDVIVKVYAYIARGGKCLIVLPLIPAQAKELTPRPLTFNALGFVE